MEAKTLGGLRETTRVCPGGSRYGARATYLGQGPWQYKRRRVDGPLSMVEFNEDRKQTVNLNIVLQCINNSSYFYVQCIILKL